MIRIDFDFQDRQFRALVEQWIEKARKLLEATVENHPFNGNELDIGHLEIKVKVGYKEKATVYMKPTAINCDNFPKIDLWLEEHHFLGQTGQEGQFTTENFSEEGFKKITLHEFGHMFDELSLIFNRDSQLRTRKESLRKSSKRTYLIFMGLWNLYIDGRLWKEDEEKLQEGIRWFEDAQKIHNKEVLRKVWNGRDLTYMEIMKHAESLVDEAN